MHGTRKGLAARPSGSDGRRILSQHAQGVSNTPKMLCVTLTDNASERFTCQRHDRYHPSPSRIVRHTFENMWTALARASTALAYEDVEETLCIKKAGSLIVRKEKIVTMIFVRRTRL